MLGSINPTRSPASIPSDCRNVAKRAAASSSSANESSCASHLIAMASGYIAAVSVRLRLRLVTAVFQFGGAVASGAAPFMVFERWPTVDGADTDLTGPQHNRRGAAVGGGRAFPGPLVTSGMVIGEAWAGSTQPGPRQRARLAI